MDKPYDPKLRDVAIEFENLCKKYDCAGFAVFVSPTHAEFVHRISPSWSVARLEEGVLRFRSKKEDFASREDQHFKTESTVHMLTSAMQWSNMLRDRLNNVIGQLREHMKIFYKVWDQPDSVPGDGQ